MFWKENGKMFVIIPFFVRSPSPALRSSTHSTWCCSTRSTRCRTWRSSRFCRSPPSPPVLATSPLKQFTRWFDSGWYYDISNKCCSSVTVSMWWASSTCCSTLEGKRCVLFFFKIMWDVLFSSSVLWVFLVRWRTTQRMTELEGEDYLGEIKKMTPFSHIPWAGDSNKKQFQDRCDRHLFISNYLGSLLWGLCSENC